jgi:hypothetical protein
VKLSKEIGLNLEDSRAGVAAAKLMLDEKSLYRQVEKAMAARRLAQLSGAFNGFQHKRIITLTSRFSSYC